MVFGQTARFHRVMLETGMRRPVSIDTVERISTLGEFAAEEARAALVWSRSRAEATIGFAFELFVRLSVLGEACGGPSGGGSGSGWNGDGDGLDAGRRKPRQRPEPAPTEPAQSAEPDANRTASESAEPAERETASSAAATRSGCPISATPAWAVPNYGCSWARCSG